MMTFIFFSLGKSSRHNFERHFVTFSKDKLVRSFRVKYVKEKVRFCIGEFRIRPSSRSKRKKPLLLLASNFPLPTDRPTDRPTGERKLRKLSRKKRAFRNENGEQRRTRSAMLCVGLCSKMTTTSALSKTLKIAFIPSQGRDDQRESTTTSI